MSILKKQELIIPDSVLFIMKNLHHFLYLQVSKYTNVLAVENEEMR